MVIGNPPAQLLRHLKGHRRDFGQSMRYGRHIALWLLCVGVNAKSLQDARFSQRF